MGLSRGAEAGLGALVLLLAGAPLLRADVVQLDGGREMTGLITRETPAEIDLDIGYGTVTLKKSAIASIKRSAPKGREALLRAKRFRDLENGEGAPAGGEALLAAYRKAARARDDLRDAREGRTEDEEAGAEGAAKLAALVSDNKKVAQELSEAGQGSDPRYYNGLVARFNAGTASIRAKELELAERRDADSGFLDRSRDYLSAYQDFRREFRAYPAPAETTTKDDREFFELLRDALAAMGRDFSQEKVAAERRGSHWVVAAVLDGKVKARLLVDTGASMVMISRAVADRLGPEAVKRGKAKVSVADGRELVEDVLELSSVEVGQNRAERVVATVSPSAPEEGIDGLLGMTFLSRFGFETDPRSGTLYLRRLK